MITGFYMVSNLTFLINLINDRFLRGNKATLSVEFIHLGGQLTGQKLCIRVRPFVIHRATDINESGCDQRKEHMLINRKKMLAVMDKFTEVLFIRSLYGNFYKIGGHNSADILVTDPAQGVGWLAEIQPPFISTTEDSFAGGEVGCYIRAKFPEPCKYETISQGAKQ